MTVIRNTITTAALAAVIAMFAIVGLASAGNATAPPPAPVVTTEVVCGGGAKNVWWGIRNVGSTAIDITYSGAATGAATIPARRAIHAGSWGNYDATGIHTLNVEGLFGVVTTEVDLGATQECPPAVASLTVTQDCDKGTDVTLTNTADIPFNPFNVFGGTLASGQTSTVNFGTDAGSVAVTPLSLKGVISGVTVSAEWPAVAPCPPPVVVPPLVPPAPPVELAPPVVTVATPVLEGPVEGQLPITGSLTQTLGIIGGIVAAAGMTIAKAVKARTSRGLIG